MVYTKNNPLTYILTTIKLDAMGPHWIASLAPYKFTIKYKSGKTNVETDASFHIQWDRTIGSEAIQTIMSAVTNEARTIMEVLAQSLRVGEFLKIPLPAKSMTQEDWERAQKADPVLNQVMALYEKKCPDLSQIKRAYAP